MKKIMAGHCEQDIAWSLAETQLSVKCKFMDDSILDGLDQSNFSSFLEEKNRLLVQSESGDTAYKGLDKQISEILLKLSEHTSLKLKWGSGSVRSLMETLSKSEDHDIVRNVATCLESISRKVPGDVVEMVTSHFTEISKYHRVERSRIHIKPLLNILMNFLNTNDQEVHRSLSQILLLLAKHPNKAFVDSLFSSTDMEAIFQTLPSEPSLAKDLLMILNHLFKHGPSNAIRLGYFFNGLAYTNDFSTQKKVAETLHHLDMGTLQTWTHFAGSGDVDLKKWAADILGRRQFLVIDDESLPCLEQLVTHKDPDIQRSVSLMLGHMSSEAVPEELRSRVVDLLLTLVGISSCCGNALMVLSGLSQGEDAQWVGRQDVIHTLSKLALAEGAIETLAQLSKFPTLVPTLRSPEIFDLVVDAALRIDSPVKASPQHLLMFLDNLFKESGFKDLGERRSTKVQALLMKIYQQEDGHERRISQKTIAKLLRSFAEIPKNRESGMMGTSVVFEFVRSLTVGNDSRDTVEIQRNVASILDDLSKEVKNCGSLGLGAPDMAALVTRLSSSKDSYTAQCANRVSSALNKWRPYSDSLGDEVRNPMLRDLPT